MTDQATYETRIERSYIRVSIMRDGRSHGYATRKVASKNEWGVTRVTPTENNNVGRGQDYDPLVLSHRLHACRELVSLAEKLDDLTQIQLDTISVAEPAQGTKLLRALLNLDQERMS